MGVPQETSRADQQEEHWGGIDTQGIGIRCWNYVFYRLEGDTWKKQLAMASCLGTAVWHIPSSLPLKSTPFPPKQHQTRITNNQTPEVHVLPNRQRRPAGGRPPAQAHHLRRRGEPPSPRAAWRLAGGKARKGQSLKRHEGKRPDAADPRLGLASEGVAPPSYV